MLLGARWGPLVRSGEKRGATEYAPRGARDREELSEQASQMRCVVSVSQKRELMGIPNRCREKSLLREKDIIQCDQAECRAMKLEKYGFKQSPRLRIQLRLNRMTCFPTVQPLLNQHCSLLLSHLHPNPEPKVLNSYNATSPEWEFFRSKDYSRNGQYLAQNECVSLHFYIFGDI